MLAALFLLSFAHCGVNSDDEEDDATADDATDDDTERDVHAEVVVIDSPPSGNLLARHFQIITNVPCSLSGFVTSPGEVGYGPSNPLATDAGVEHSFWFYGLLKSTIFDYTFHVAGAPDEVVSTGRFLTPDLPESAPRPDTVINNAEDDPATWFAFWVGDWTTIGEMNKSSAVIYDRSGRIRYFHKMEDPQSAMIVVMSDGEMVMNDHEDLIGIRLDGTQYKLIDLNIDQPYYTPTHHQFFIEDYDAKTALILFNRLGSGYECDGVTPTDQAVGDGVVEVDRDGNELWRWTAFEHQDEIPPVAPGLFSCIGWFFGGDTVDWTHGNAVAPAPGRNAFLVSFRNLNRIVKVDRESGEILWQLGRDLDFEWIGDEPESERWFSVQHDPHWLSNGHLLLFDNSYAIIDGVGMHGLWSRALELELDEEAMTVRLVFEYRVPLTIILGSVERNENGNTLVTTGSQATAFEVTSEGELLWKLGFDEILMASAARYYPALWNYE